MSVITLGPARGLSLDDLTRLMNRAFSDYIVPLQLSPSSFQSMVERDDVLLDSSYVAWVNGEPLGLALVAVRPWHGSTRSRLAAMGVVPEGRRMGVGRALLRHVIDQEQRRGSQILLLEVFAGNTAARRLYEAHGFVAQRQLLGLTLDGARLHKRDAHVVALHPIDAATSLALFAACMAGEAPEAAPPWQLDAPALARFGPPTALYAITTADTSAVTTGVSGPAGFLVLGTARPVAQLVHLGIVPARRRRGLATSALAAALQRHPDILSLYVPPVLPAASSLVPFLQALGATADAYEQIEMARALR